ncbi:MAG: hypothetical protein AAF441_27805 [Pseudomonadota bacterium]
MSRAKVKNPRKLGPYGIGLAKELKSLKVSGAQWFKNGTGHFWVEFTWLGEPVELNFAGSPRNPCWEHSQTRSTFQKKLKSAAARSEMRAEIERLKTPTGGWTRDGLATLGVPWPPPEGWEKALVDFAGEDA